MTAREKQIAEFFRAEADYRQARGERSRGERSRVLEIRTDLADPPTWNAIAHKVDMARIAEAEFVYIVGRGKTAAVVKDREGYARQIPAADLWIPVSLYAESLDEVAVIDLT